MRLELEDRQESTNNIVQTCTHSTKHYPSLIPTNTLQVAMLPSSTPTDLDVFLFPLPSTRRCSIQVDSEYYQFCVTPDQSPSRDTGQTSPSSSGPPSTGAWTTLSKGAYTDTTRYTTKKCLPRANFDNQISTLETNLQNCR